MHQVTGLIAAVHTPLDEHGGFRPSVVQAQSEYLSSQPVVGVYVCGSTGESLSLSVPERKQVLEAWMTNRWPTTTSELFFYVHRHVLSTIFVGSCV